MSSDLEGDLNQDGIIDEMDRVRGDLDGGINQLGEQMRNMFDWQAYVRSAPLTSAAAAVVLGYLLAPRLGSRPVMVAASDSSAGNSTATSGGGVTKTLTNIVWSGLAQAGSIYIAELLTGQLTGSKTQPNPDSSEKTEPTFDQGDEI